MERKAFSTIDIKSTSESNGRRTFKGIASTPSPDRDEDIMESTGAEYKMPLPFLWQHNARDPIGWITKVNVTKSGIEVEGEVASIVDTGSLKTRIDEYWQMLKNKLVRGLSIGFKALEYSRRAGTDFGKHITRWEWLELSAVTIPANQDASITNIKAAFGHKQSPGATGQQRKSNTMKTLHEQLAELKELRATKAARMAEITESIKAKTASDEDSGEFDSLYSEIADLDNDIRVKQAECLSAQSAKPVTPSVKTGVTIINRKTDVAEKFKGQNYTRMIIAKAAARIEDVSPVAIAQKRWGKENPQLVQLIKAAVEGGGAGSGEWGAELVSADNRYTGDFIELLTASTVFDRLPLRMVPANVTIKGQDGAATGYWVGESKAIPASAQSFSDVSLTPLKAAALAVISNELMRDSSPSAEMLVRDALVDASAQRVDTTFISATAASAGVSPAGILNGITPDSATGTDADALRADVKTLMADFIAANNATGLQFVMHPSLALSIGMLYNALGNPEFPGITEQGGTLFGKPVITGENVASDDLILLKPSDIYRIGDTGIRVEISREAAIEMDSAPAMDSQAPTTASGALVGMFQTESTAIKVVRSINFARRRTGSQCVGFIGDAAYDNSTVS